MSKILIDDKAMQAIKGHAVRAFHERRSFNGMSTSEVQQFAIITGLGNYLKSQGVEPPFELPVELQESYNPIEEEWTPVKDPKK